MGHRGPMGAGVMLQDKKRARSTKFLLKIFYSNYLVGFLKVILVVSFFIIISAFANALAPILISQSLDLISYNSPLDLMIPLVGLYLALTIGIWLIDSITNWILAELRANVMNKIRKDVFQKLSKADMSYFQKHQAGEITNRVIGDTEEVATGITVISNTSSQLLLVVTTFIVLFTINWTFALVSLLSIPFAFLLTRFLGTVGKDRMLKVRKSLGIVSAKLSEFLAGVSIAKSFNREEFTSKKIKALNDESYNYFKGLGVIFTIVMPSIQMISSILVAIILFLGGSLFGSGMSIGIIYLGVIMVQRFLSPVIHLSMYWTQLQSSLAAFDRIVDVNQFKPSIMNSENAITINNDSPAISFNNLSFEYKTGTKVLDNVSFNIQKGEKIALIGATGAGKTTISKLLMRFYDPTEGSITINDIDLKNYTLESIHSKFSLVPQEPYLFADTILANIKYGKPEVSDKEVIELCQLIGADKFIKILPKGYETILEENGKSLSAGQRQMITIARTMIQNPSFLILDEATSRLDAYSESLVQHAQKKLFEGRTTLVIAHRLSTIKDVNRILVIEKGKIIENGSHEELIVAKGKYFELYNAYYAHQGLTSDEDLLDIAIEEEKPSIPIIKHHSEKRQMPH